MRWTRVLCVGHVRERDRGRWFVDEFRRRRLERHAHLAAHGADFEFCVWARDRGSGAVLGLDCR